MKLFASFLLVTLVVAFFFVGHSHQQLPLSRQYQYNTTLATDGSFDLFWSIQDGDLYMAMSAQTNGWLAVGFNSFVENNAEDKDTDMKLTDMIIGWRDSSGKTYLYDSYAMSNSIPSIDNQLGGIDNSVLIQSWETTGRTIIEFKRALDTKDSYDLTMIPNMKLILLYALSAQDPNNNQYSSLSIHTKRGKVGIPNFWPLLNDTISEKQSSSLNVSQSNQTGATLTTSTSITSSSGNNSSTSTNQTTINIPIPVVLFPPQNNNKNSTSSTQNNNSNINQTIIVIPPIFPTNSSQIIIGGGGVVASSGRPGKEKPLYNRSAPNCGHRYSLLIVMNLMMVHFWLSVM